jgi:hypothetical protein
MEEGLPSDTSAFYEGNPELKSANIVFEYSEAEMTDLARCANDVVYFANKFCYSMTDEGVQQITLRPYQENMLEDFQDNRFVVMLASRQIGKCSLYDTKVTIKYKDGSIKLVSVGNLYYITLSIERKLTLIEKIKWSFWKLYDKL